MSTVAACLSVAGKWFERLSDRLGRNATRGRSALLLG
jgi:hypothetical protein